MARLPCNIRVKHKNRYAQSIQDLRKHLYRNFQLDRTFGTMFFETVGRTNGRTDRQTAARSNTMPFGHRKTRSGPCAINDIQFCFAKDIINMGSVSGWASKTLLTDAWNRTGTFRCPLWFTLYIISVSDIVKLFRVQLLILKYLLFAVFLWRLFWDTVVISNYLTKIRQNCCAVVVVPSPASWIHSPHVEAGLVFTVMATFAVVWLSFNKWLAVTSILLSSSWIVKVSPSVNKKTNFGSRNDKDHARNSTGFLFCQLCLQTKWCTAIWLTAIDILTVSDSLFPPIENKAY